MPFGGGDGGNAADDGSGDDAGGGDGGGTLQCELAESHRITAVEKVDGRQRCSDHHRQLHVALVVDTDTDDQKNTYRN